MRDDQRICLSCGELVKQRVAASERLQVAPAGVPSWIAFEGAQGRGSAVFPAGRIQRILAALIDAVIVGVIAYALSLVIGEAVTAEGSLAANEQPEITVHWARLIPVAAMGALYYIVFPATRWQGTPGKRLLGLRIVTVEHLPISIFQSFARYFCMQVCWLIVFPLAAMVALFGLIAVPVAFLILMGGGRSPWDWMAGTMVVD